MTAVEVRPVRLVGLTEDLPGIAAYMEISALNRLLEEGDVVNGGELQGGCGAPERVPARAQGHPRDQLGSRERNLYAKTFGKRLRRASI